MLRDYVLELIEKSKDIRIIKNIGKLENKERDLCMHPQAKAEKRTLSQNE